jgi:hypothetical protein
LDVAVESLEMQQLHGFDELRYDQGIIRNRSAKINTTVIVRRLTASYFTFRLLPLANTYFSFRSLPLAKIVDRKENGENRVFLVVRMEIKITLTAVFQNKRVSEWREMAAD